MTGCDSVCREKPKIFTLCSFAEIVCWSRKSCRQLVEKRLRLLRAQKVSGLPQTFAYSAFHPVPASEQDGRRYFPHFTREKKRGGSGDEKSKSAGLANVGLELQSKSVWPQSSFISLNNMSSFCVCNVKKRSPSSEFMYNEVWPKVKNTNSKLLFKEREP